METLSGNHWKIHVGDVMEGLALVPSESVHCVVTSPPYWGLRDYGYDGQIGLERTPAEYVQSISDVFNEVRRVLRSDGVCFINIGDSYAAGAGSARNLGSRVYGKQNRLVLDGKAFPQSQPNRMNIGLPARNLVGVPWRVAFRLQADGWILRSETVWAKPSPMPESVSGWRWKKGKLNRGSWRPTKAHEQIFMLVKSGNYFCDGDGSKEKAVGGAPGNKTHKGKTAYENGDGHHRTKVGLTEIGAVENRNMRSVWRISTESYKGAHFATYPTELVRRCLVSAISLAGCCSACGRQYAPIVESQRSATRPGTNSKVPGKNSRMFQDRDPNHSGEYKTAKYEGIVHPESPHHEHGGKVVGNRDPQRHTTTTVVTGYLPTCKCEAATGRPIVLDPFGGSMTTGQVAVNMGCDFIGLEANPEYAALGVQRINTAWVPVAERRSKPKSKRRKKDKRQAELF